MARLLITGGSSYLGCHLVPLAAAQFDLLYTHYRRDPLGLPFGRQIDLRDGRAFRELVLQFQPQAIIHVAGSNRTPDMENVISQGAKHVVGAARLIDAKLIHLSTDVIFDGQSPPYSESSSPTPLNDYGRAKAGAETIVSQYENHVIIRTSLIYGLTMVDHSTNWIKSALEANQSVVLFNNQIRQPVWAISLALACLEVSQSSFTGTLNIAGSQAMSRAEYGLKLLDWWGIDSKGMVSVGPASDQWPLDTRLDLSLAQSLLSVPLLGFEQVLALHRAN